MINSIIKQKFQHYSTQHSSSFEHYPTFFHFGKKCSSIVEIGVEQGGTTWAWFACEPAVLTCVDVNEHGSDHIGIMKEVAAEVGVNFKFLLADSGHGTLEQIHRERAVSIPHEFLHRDPYVMDAGVELLYIDTYHSYTHLKAELTIHGNHVSKYILMHDTTAYGETHDFDGDRGLNYAIDEFLQANPHWHKIMKVDYNNGLTVLANKNNTTDTPNLDPELKYPLPDLIIG